MNIWIGAGRITKDLELKTTSTGVEYLQFSVAVDDGKDKDGNRMTQFIDCTAWRQSAAFIAKYYKKGDGIEIRGKLKNDSYTDKDGNKRSKTTVSIDETFFPQGKASGNSSSTTTEPAFTPTESTGDDLPF